MSPRQQTGPAFLIERARLRAGPLPPHDVLQLQRSIGNRAVSRLIARGFESRPGRKAENRTGLPDDLKAGVETLSGISLDDVKVHYNSEEPARLRALAYAQGAEIHVGPGQEEHLPHEAWHVVQQKRGEVRPTTRFKEAEVNEDLTLEREADVMGQRAARIGSGHPDDAPGTRRAQGQDLPEVLPVDRSARAPLPAQRKVIQMLPVRSSAAARKTARTELIKAGFSDVWDLLVTRIGALTILEDVGVADLATLLRRNNYDVDLVIRVINNASAADIADIKGQPGNTGLFQGLGALRLPTDQEIDRYYANYLRDRIAAGAAPPYAPNMYDNFRNNMRANGGQYWDFAAAAFRRMTEAYRDVYNNAPTDAPTFCNNIYAGQNVNFVTHTLAAVPLWAHNFNLATGYELSTFLANVPAGYSRPYDQQMRTAIGLFNAHLPAAQVAINLGGNVAQRLSTLLDAVRDSQAPVQMLTALDLVLNPPVGAAVATGFPLAMNHTDELTAAAPRLNPLTQNMPFGNRAGGLRGHFIKHPLGVQAAPHQPTALWEAQQWLPLLNLAPNGTITLGQFTALTRYSKDEWSIFAQHAHGYRAYYYVYYGDFGAASQPTTAAEVQAMIAYFQTASANAQQDATALAVAHENTYQTYVSNQFDAAANRYLYFDAGVLKVNAMAGNLFMVAAWNGHGDFDLSTGFLINGGALAQYNSNLAQRMMNV